MIYNRLKAGMTLGIDATLRYGLDIPPTESIRQSQLDSNNPYNTRKLPGLTPTPIANPGLASMQAAAHPAKVDYLFFARKPDKVHHFFTASEAEFLQYLAENGYGAMITASTRLVALLGHPVEHSLSPRMQNAAFAALALDWAYVALDVPPERLEEARARARRGGLRGRERHGAAQARGGEARRMRTRRP